MQLLYASLPAIFFAFAFFSIDCPAFGCHPYYNVPSPSRLYIKDLLLRLSFLPLIIKIEMGLWDKVDIRWLVLPNTCCHPLLFYIWRIAYALYVVILFYLYNESFPEDRQFPKTLTVWCGLFVALSAAALLLFHILTGFGQFVNSFFQNLHGCGLTFARFIYLIYEIGVSLQLLVPALYWIGEYPALQEDQRPVGYELFLEANLHGVFAILIILDYLFGQIDVIKSHIWVQQLFTITYIIFNYWYSTNYGIIYPIISWDNAFTYIFVAIAILFSILGFYLCAFIGGALMLMILRSQTIIGASQQPDDPVPGWEEEAIFMAFIFGAALVFFYFTLKLASLKDKNHHVPTQDELSQEEPSPLLFQQDSIELASVRAMNEPASGGFGVI